MKPLLERMLLELIFTEAMQKAKQIIKILKPYVTRIAIAGSLARKHEDVGDVDLVAVLKDDNIKEVLGKTPKVSNIGGGEQTINFDYDGIGFNLWMTPEKSFEATWLHFAWGKGIIRAKMVAKDKGYKLTRYGIFKDDKFITGKMKEIFKIIGMEPKKDIGIENIIG
jgi:DNA polymerase/3'-5' exonuclease PolX